MKRASARYAAARALLERRRRILAALFLLAVCGVLFFPGLDKAPIHTKGEGREALQVWEEVTSGEWILPLRNGEEIPSKPPLFHWLAGLSALGRGQVDEVAVRLPSALLATLTVLAVFWFGARQWGVSTGIIAACMLAGNFEWIRAARQARVDMTLTACLTGSLLAFGVAAEDRDPRLPALLAFYLFAALAVLAKGPVGVVLPALVSLADLAARRDLTRIRRLQPLLGCSIVLLIPALWYGLAVLEGGEAFVHKQLLRENLQRFTGGGTMPHSHAHAFFYHFSSLLIGFAPWSFFLPWLAVSACRRREHAPRRLLYPLLWIAVIFLFYSAASGKRTVYILPLYPAAALALAAWWDAQARQRGPDRAPPARAAMALAWAVAVLAGLLALAVALEASGVSLLGALRPLLHPRDQANLPLVHDALRAAPLLALCGSLLAFAASLALLRFTARGGWHGAFASLLALVVAVHLVAEPSVERAIAQRTTLKSFAAAVGERVGTEPLAFYRTFDYGFTFYARRHIPRVDRLAGGVLATGGYLLLSESEWRRLDAQARSRLAIELASPGTVGKAGHLLLARVHRA